jgi:hypothetical protein
MVVEGDIADDADMLAVRPHRTYHVHLRVLFGLATSTLVLFLAQISQI